MESGNQLMYKDLAKYYDLLYSHLNYRKEAKLIEDLISKFKKSDGKDLLELGCGTGKHLKFIKNKFRCIGTDINLQMIEIAKKNVKGVKFQQADMTNLNLNRKFDVIISLFSSIGYVKTYENLEKTIKNISRHLKPGGFVIIEPWLTKAKFKIGRPYMLTYKGKDINICRVNVSKIKGNTTILDFHFLIAEKNKEVKYFRDVHELGLFDTNKTLDFMKKSGLTAKFIEIGERKDRGMYIATKPLK